MIFACCWGECNLRTSSHGCGFAPLHRKGLAELLVILPLFFPKSLNVCILLIIFTENFHLILADLSRFFIEKVSKLAFFSPKNLTKMFILCIISTEEKGML